LTDYLETIEYISFLIRLWHERDTQSSAPCWHAEVEHIQTGQHWEFKNVTELLDFLRLQVNETNEKD